MFAFQLHVPVPQNRRRPTLREIAHLIRACREAERLSIHADRDRCLPHHLAGAVLANECWRFLPKRIQRQAHRRIVAPAAREFARADERAEP